MDTELEDLNFTTEMFKSNFIYVINENVKMITEASLSINFLNRKAFDFSMIT